MCCVVTINEVPNNLSKQLLYNSCCDKLQRKMKNWDRRYHTQVPWLTVKSSQIDGGLQNECSKCNQSYEHRCQQRQQKVVVVAKSAWTIALLRRRRLTASLDTSAGERLLSSQISSNHHLLGRPGRHFLDESGSRPSDNLAWQCRVWWAGTVCGILAMCLKKELRRLTMFSMTGGKPDCFVTSMFWTWSCYRMLSIRCHNRSWTISISNLSLLLTVTSNNFISPCRYIQWNCSYKISQL